jgi:hypothetical protein
MMKISVIDQTQVKARLVDEDRTVKQTRTLSERSKD